MDSTIFLHNVTHVDCAVVNPITMKPHGLSFVPMFAVSGSTDNEEQVVEDFSSVKKRIKSLIDSKGQGYDHKLLVFRFRDNQQSDALINGNQDFTLNAMEDCGWLVNAPFNAFKAIYIDEPVDEDKYIDVIAKDMSEYLTRNLGLSVKVIVPPPVPVWPSGLPYLNVKGTYTTHNSFSYTHGLPCSSSWGCQNVIHGHRSFVFLASTKYLQDGEHYGQDVVAEVLQSITSYLDGAYIVCQDHYVRANNTHFIRYKTKERGSFELRMAADEHTKVIVLPYEPTIENITDHIATVFEEDLAKAKVCTLAISEGLWKGAVVEFPVQED